MIDFKNQIVKLSFKEMADIQDVIEQLYYISQQDEIDPSMVKLSCESIAEACGVTLTDAAFQGCEQTDGQL